MKSIRFPMILDETFFFFVILFNVLSTSFSLTKKKNKNKSTYMIIKTMAEN